MTYYIYHIPGEKIGVTKSPVRRVENQQGFASHEYEIIEKSDDIDYVSWRELELQKHYGYRIDKTLYKNLNVNNKMKINITDQTTTFPCPMNKLKGRLMDNIGLEISTKYMKHTLDHQLIGWILNNVATSQFSNDRCYVYNKAMYNFHQVLGNIKAWGDENGHVPLSYFMFDQIRDWAKERGLYTKGDSKTQYVKLMEESGELARALLKKDKVEVVDAIGDMVVVLTNLAYIEGFNIENCIKSAYDVIKKRQGKMINGTFVKD